MYNIYLESTCHFFQVTKMYKLLFILLLNCTPELIFLRFNLILEDEVVSALFNIASKNLIKISE